MDIKDYKIKIVTDVEECKSLWNKYFSGDSLWDVWEVNFILCYGDPYFIVGEDKAGIAFIIPLEKTKSLFTFMGSSFPEQRRFYCKDKEFFLNNVVSFLPNNCELDYLLEEFKFEGCFPNDDSTRYFIDLSNISDVFDIFESFNKKHKKNILNDIRKVPSYSVRINNIADFEQLIELNKKRFGDESNLFYDGREERLRKLIDFFSSKKMLNLFSIVINDKVEAVGLGVICKNSYYLISVGSNIDIKNLGKVLILESIKQALSNKCKMIDFLSEDAGWKKLWNCSTEVQYNFVKK